MFAYGLGTDINHDEARYWIKKGQMLEDIRLSTNESCAFYSRGPLAWSKSDEKGI